MINRNTRLHITCLGDYGKVHESTEHCDSIEEAEQIIESFKYHYDDFILLSASFDDKVIYDNWIEGNQKEG